MHPGYTEPDAGPVRCANHAPFAPHTGCLDDAYDACEDGYCIECCAQAGADNGDGFACPECSVELGRRLLETFPMRTASASGFPVVVGSGGNPLAPASPSDPAAATPRRFITDRIVTCGMPACGRAILASRGFRVTGYDEVLCASCTSSLRECEVELR